MALKFRNVDASPDDPVESWPQEGIQAALERGSLSDWGRIQRAVARAPWGPVARSLEQVLTYCKPCGVAGLMERGLARARSAAERAERDEVATRVRRAIAKSSLDRKRFAEAIGTSESRLSTYATGSVCPSAAMLLRIEGVAENAVGTLEA